MKATIRQQKNEIRNNIIDNHKELKGLIHLLAYCVVNIESAEDLLNDEQRLIAEQKENQEQSVEEMKAFLRKAISGFTLEAKKLKHFISDIQEEIEEEVQDCLIDSVIKEIRKPQI